MEVARIVAGRGEGSDCTMHAGGGKLFCMWYLVHWKGYSPIYESTWETRKSLVDTAKATLEYYEKKNQIDATDAAAKQDGKRVAWKRKARR